MISFLFFIKITTGDGGNFLYNKVALRRRNKVVKMDLKDLCKFHVQRCSSRLSKNSLELIEDLEIEQLERISKLKDIVPSEFHGYIDQFVLFTEEKKSHIRKRTLDNGGTFIREIFSELDKYKIDLK